MRLSTYEEQTSPFIGALETMSAKQLTELSESDVLMHYMIRAQIHHRASVKYCEEGFDEESKQQLCESIAFKFMVSNDDEKRRFYPSVVFTNGQNGKVEFPSLSNFDNKVYDYLRGRIHDTQNPAIIARFADIIWCARRSDSYTQAKVAIDAYHAFVDRWLATPANTLNYGIDLCDALIRSINIAQQLKQNDLVETGVHKAIDVCNQLDANNYNMPMQDILAGLLTKYDKIKQYVSETNLQDMIKNANSSIKLLDAQYPYYADMQRCLMVSIRKIYTILNNARMIEEMTKRIADNCVFEANWIVDNLHLGHRQAIRLGEEAIIEYHKIGDKHLICAVQAHIFGWHKAAESEMSVFDTSVEVPKDEIDRWLHKFKVAPISDVAMLICSDRTLMPSAIRARMQATRYKEEFPLIFAINHQLVSEEMSLKFIPTTESGDELLEYYTAWNIRINYQFVARILLIKLFDHLEQSHKDYIEHFVKHVSGSPMIKHSRATIVVWAFEAQSRGDYTSCIHILAPQIEGCLRDIAKHLAIQITEMKRQGEWSYITLNTIIQRISDTKRVDDDLLRFINLLLCSQYGDNLRNEVCHGIANIRDMSRENALLMIYIVLMLCSIDLESTPQAN